MCHLIDYKLPRNVKRETPLQTNGEVVEWLEQCFHSPRSLQPAQWAQECKEEFPDWFETEQKRCQLTLPRLGRFIFGWLG